MSQIEKFQEKMYFVSKNASYTHQFWLRNSAGTFEPRMYNIFKGEPRFTDYRLRKLIDTLRAVQGADFNLNEFPRMAECDETNREFKFQVYIDYDGKLEQNILDTIEEALGCIVDGELKVTYEHKPNKQNVWKQGAMKGQPKNTGRYHIKTNIKFPEVVNKSAVLQYLRDYLWQNVDGLDEELTRERWYDESEFDVSALGENCAYSIKIKDGEIVERDAGTYVPMAKPDIEPAEVIFRNSIYIVSPFHRYCAFNPETLAAIRTIDTNMVMMSEAKKEVREAKRAAQKQIYDRAARTVEIFKVKVPLTPELVNRIMRCISPARANAAQWMFIVRAFANIGSVLDGPIDVEYLLHNWSKQGEGYDALGNERIWRNIAHAGLDVNESLCAVIGIAIKDDYPTMSRLAYPGENISNPNIAENFSDYLRFTRGVYDRNEINNFIKNNIAYIINGNKSFYMTKQFKDGELKFDQSAKMPDTRVNIRTIEYDDGVATQKVIKRAFAKCVEEMLIDISYHWAEFMPYLKTPPKSESFNLFAGLRHTFDSEFQVDHNMIEPIIHHARYALCNGKDELFHYFIKCMAHIVQKPQERLKVAMVIKSSKEGAGKNTFFEFFGNKVLGGKYYKTVNRIDDLAGNFNGDMVGKLMIVLDECQINGAYNISEFLKSIITQDKITIREKYQPEYTVNDYSNLIFLTNNDWVVRLGPSDRRYFCLEMDNRYVGDRAYFNNLYRYTKYELADECARNFFHYLAQMDLTGFNPADIPNTEFKEDLKLGSQPKPILFLIELARGSIEVLKWAEDGTMKVFTSVLYAAFNQWRDANGYRESPPMISFSRDIGKIEKSRVIRIGGDRANGYEFHLETLREAIRAFLRNPGLEFEAAE